MVDDRGAHQRRRGRRGPAADVASLTALADDWAVQDPSSPGDRFDANFSAIWSPIRSGEARVDAEVREAWTALAALDPTGFADVAQLDATGNVSTARLWAPASRTVPLPDVAAWRDTADRAGFALAVSGEAVDQSRLADTAPERVWAVAWTAAVAATLTAIAWGLAAAGDGTLGLGAGVSASVAALGTAGLLSALAGAEPVGLVLAPAVAAALAQAWATGPLPALARDLEQGAETEAAIAEARAAWATRAPLAAILLVTLALVWWTVPSVALASASASLLLAALVGSACGLVLQPAWAGLWAVPLARTRSMSAAPSAHLDCPVCRRRTATGASRCARCGRWHLVEACPAHPDVFPGRCVDCGSELAAPHFR